MGRRVRRFLVIPAAAIVLLTLLLATCNNDFDIFEAIKTDVKIANDLFLNVKSVSPEENATLVNPGVPIVIVFDRSINPDTVDVSTVVFTPALSGVVFDYNENTKTLSAEPVPYMNGPETYEVRITKGVKGADGSELQNEMIWSFETREWPAGSVSINGGADYIADNSNVTLNITYNTQVQWMKYSTNEADLIPAGNWVAAATMVSNFVLDPSGDGERTVYIKFADSSLTNESDVEIDTIFRDTVAPTVDVGTTPRTINIYTSPSPPSAVWQYATVTDDAPSSGIEAYSWSLVSGPGTITFGNQSSEDTTILASTDSANTSDYYTIRLTATDNAGNPSSSDVQILWDRTPPGTPTFTASTTESPTTDTTPSWYWQTGGGGSGTYRRKLDSGSYVSTTATSYTPSLSYGPHTLYVEEQDIFYNYSSVASRTIYVSPDITPLWGETNVSLAPTLSWPSAGLLYTYDVYLGTSIASAVKIATVTKGTSFTIPSKPGLNTSTTYYWFYFANYGRTSTRYPSSTKQAYSFTTTKLRL